MPHRPSTSLSGLVHLPVKLWKQYVPHSHAQCVPLSDHVPHSHAQCVPLSDHVPHSHAQCVPLSDHVPHSHAVCTTIRSCTTQPCTVCTTVTSITPSSCTDLFVIYWRCWSGEVHCSAWLMSAHDWRHTHSSSSCIYNVCVCVCGANYCLFYAQYTDTSRITQSIL